MVDNESSEIDIPAGAIPGYEILGLIGKGGMGSVYRARQTSLDRIVALKVLTAVHSSDQELIRRFRREIDLHSKLTHPNLVRVLDGGFEKSQRYLVLEYLEGQTLFDVIRRDAPLDGAYATGIAHQLTAGVAYLHEQGLTHRDLKPPNAMVVEEGLVKLLDFGLARGDHHTAMTEADRIIGTLAYIAPEILEGELAGKSADVYALGLITYELLVGRLPYQGHDLDSWVDHIVGTVPEPIHHFAPRTPESLSLLVSRMLEKLPRHRPSAAEIVEELEQVLHTIGVKTTEVLTMSRIFALRTPLGASTGSPKAYPQDATTASIIDPGDAATERFHAGPAKPAAWPSSVHAAADLSTQAQSPKVTRLPGQPRTLTFYTALSSINTLASRILGQTLWGTESLTRGGRRGAIGLTAGTLLMAATAFLWTREPEAVTQTRPVFAWKLQFRNDDTVWTDRYIVEGEDLDAARTTSEALANSKDSQALSNLAYMAEHPAQSEDRGVQALPLWERAANAGSTEAMVRLGWIHAQGDGVPRDPERALGYLQKASAAGSSVADTIRAEIYRRGLGVEVDYRKSLEALRLAVERGDPLGMHTLGLHYTNGWGLPFDHVMALNLYRQGAEKDEDSATRMVGKAYAYGKGVKQDLKEAFRWYQRAADLGNPGALQSLAACYNRGDGIEKDVAKGLEFYRRAAEAGDILSQVRLGDLYQHGYDIVKPDNRMALSWMNRAASQGSIDAQLALGKFYGESSEGGAQPNLALAVHHLQLAVDGGSAEAMNILGARYEKGIGVGTDPGRAVDLYTRSAAAGFSLAKINLGRMCELGIGIRSDLPRAHILYEEAARANLVDGQYHLGRFLLSQAREPRDKLIAREWLSAAATSGHELASRLLKEQSAIVNGPAPPNGGN